MIVALKKCIIPIHYKYINIIIFTLQIYVWIPLQALHTHIYVRLFNDSLKPKHHFLIHYPTIIEYSGPPRHFWCFRYEIKMYARATSSRKNITLTLAKKYQYKFAHILLQHT